MFKVRGKSSLLRDNAFMLDGCVPAEQFGKVTHVLVLRASDYVIASPGLYVYNANQVMHLDEQEHVKVLTVKSKLIEGHKKGYIQLLTHKQTWKEIEEEIESRNDSN